MRLFITSLFAFAGLLSSRIGSPDYDWVGYEETANDAIEAAVGFLK